MKIERHIVCICILLFVLSGFTQAATYYVSKKGSDANTGKSQQEAYLTIKRGVQRLAAGDTLIVGPGIYREEVMVEKSGTPEKPITIKAQYSHMTQLVGSVRLKRWQKVSGSQYTYKTPLSSSTHLVYEKDTNVEYDEMANLHLVEQKPGTFLYNSDEKMLYVHPSDDDSMNHHVVDANVLKYGIASETGGSMKQHANRRKHLIIDGFVATGYENYGIFIRNGDYCVINNCIAHHNRRGIFFFGAYKSRITNCEAFSNHDRFEQEMGNIGIRSWTWSSLLENNVVYDSKSYGIRFYGSFYGHTMRGNLAYNCNIGVHIKGGYIKHAVAQNWCRRFVDNNVVVQRQPMLFEYNVAHQCPWYGLINRAATDENISCFNSGIRCNFPYGKRENNIFLEAGQEQSARFADLAYHDFRLQSDSPYVAKKAGAYEYKGDVFYVSEKGNDDAEGTSVKKAWKTIRYATGRLQAGQTLYILPGKYSKLVLQNMSSIKPTIIRGYGKKKIILTGLELQDCENIQIEGLRVSSSSANGILINNSRNVRIAENEIIDNRLDGIHIEGASDQCTIVSNIIYANKRCGISVTAPLNTLTVMNNIVWDNAVQIAVSTKLPITFFCNYNDFDQSHLMGKIGNQNIDSLRAWQKHTRQDNHSISEIPGFADRASRDLRLMPTSRCRGRGYLDKTIGTGRIFARPKGNVSYTDVRVLQTTPTTADITWRSIGKATTLCLAYGTDLNKLDTIVFKAPPAPKPWGFFTRTRHELTIQNLKKGTRYFFKVGDRITNNDGTYVNRFDTAVYDFVTSQTDTVSRCSFYVHTNGSDHNPGTKEQPFRTITKACQMVRPGDTVFVYGGVYPECIRPMRSGLPNAPITIQAVEGQQVVISGKNLLINSAVDLTSRHNIVIRGFYFQEQGQYLPDGKTHAGQIRIIDASNIIIERCVFDGRMYYVRSVIKKSKDITIRNNIMMNIWTTFSVTDNSGTVSFLHNTFLGQTIHKISAFRNDRVVIRNNYFEDNLFPVKRMQYRVQVLSNRFVDMDYNCYALHPDNKEKRFIDYGIRNESGKPNNDDPEPWVPSKRYFIKGTLDQWQNDFKQGKHSIVTTDPKWRNSAALKKIWYRRPEGRHRFIKYDTFTADDIAFAPDSPCKRSGENGKDIGINW